MLLLIRVATKQSIKMKTHKLRCCRIVALTLLLLSTTNKALPITIEQNYSNSSIVIGLPYNILDKMSKIISRESQISIDSAMKYSISILDSAIKYSIDPILILSIISIESRFNPTARNNGAIGLMQVVGKYHKNKISSPKLLLDPHHNIDIGTQILKECIEVSKSDVSALSRYNGSFGVNTVYAKKVLKKKNKYSSEIFYDKIH